MICFVYRSSRQAGMYIYLAEKDNFDAVPESLLKMLGDVSFTFEFDLSEERKLVRAETSEVRRIMQENGYFLQMPPPKSSLLGKKAN